MAGTASAPEAVPVFGWRLVRPRRDPVGPPERRVAGATAEASWPRRSDPERRWSRAPGIETTAETAYKIRTNAWDTDGRSRPPAENPERLSIVTGPPGLDSRNYARFI